MSDQKTTTNRTLKIVQSFRNRQHPALPLSGRWLQQAGFAINMRVKVVVRDKCLVILPLDECVTMPDG